MGGSETMRDNSPMSDGDQEFLDAALDVAIQRIEEGEGVDVEALLNGRAELRARMVEVVRLAREIAVGRGCGFPTIAAIPS